MNKQFFYISLVLLIGYLALVFCDENDESSINSVGSTEIQSESKDLFDEARTRRRHKLYHLFFGWHALAIAYWIKVKVIIVAFFLGSAVFLGLRYFWPHKCNSDIAHEGPIIYDNPHTFSHHNDHIPYSVDHFDHSSHSFEPYSGYAGSYSDTAPSGVDVSGPPEGHSVKRRSLEVTKDARQAMSTEEHIAELMFSFLGLDSKACRGRFICEMEFRSQRNPISSMAFRIVGRGFFEKYTNAHNTRGQATSFMECAAFNPDCVFIEQTDVDETENVNSQNNSNDESDGNKNGEVSDTQNAIEAENEINLTTELQQRNRRRRKSRHFDLIASRLMRTGH